MSHPPQSGASFGGPKQTNSLALLKSQASPAAVLHPSFVTGLHCALPPSVTHAPLLGTSFGASQLAAPIGNSTGAHSMAQLPCTQSWRSPSVVEFGSQPGPLLKQSQQLPSFKQASTSGQQLAIAQSLQGPGSSTPSQTGLAPPVPLPRPEDEEADEDDEAASLPPAPPEPAGLFVSTVHAQKVRADKPAATKIPNVRIDRLLSSDKRSRGTDDVPEVSLEKGLLARGEGPARLARRHDLCLTPKMPFIPELVSGAKEVMFVRANAFFGSLFRHRDEPSEDD